MKSSKKRRGGVRDYSEYTIDYTIDELMEMYNKINKIFKKKDKENKNLLCYAIEKINVLM